MKRIFVAVGLCVVFFVVFFFSFFPQPVSPITSQCSITCCVNTFCNTHLMTEYCNSSFATFESDFSKELYADRWFKAAPACCYSNKNGISLPSILKPDWETIACLYKALSRTLVLDQKLKCFMLHKFPSSYGKQQKVRLSLLLKL